MPSPKSSIPDIGTASLRKTNRQLAYERALCINKSHFGETVLGRNMTETKVLEAKLEQLEKDKLMLERDHFWKQRQFLISKAFDKERRLRYSMLLNRISLKDEDNKELNLTPEDSHKLPSITDVDVSLTHQFFPGKIDSETSSNYKLILQRKRKLKATVNVLRAALELSKKNRERKKMHVKNDENSLETFSQGPGVQSTIDSENLESSEKHIMEVRKNNFLKLVVKNWKSFKRPNTEPEPPKKTSSEINRKSSSSQLPNRLLERRQSLVRTNTDELLLRLAKTLPPQVLNETNSNNLSDISSVLGFSSRNKALRQRELSVLRRPVLSDDRFLNLQNSLIRSSTIL